MGFDALFFCAAGTTSMLNSARAELARPRLQRLLTWGRAVADRGVGQRPTAVCAGAV